MTWWVRDDYSHGFLVPLISLYLVWYRRESLKRLEHQPAFFFGISVVIAAGLMLVLGERGGMITLQELSFVVMIAGLVLCLLGKNYLKALGFPIVYLLFMIPIADWVIKPLHWGFQLMTAKIGVGLLQTLGFTAYLENQYIVLPNITLEVAQACSGISYLISIIAIGIPLAYVTQKNVWCRVILVVSAVAIGVVANWIRVAAIGVWAYYGGTVVHGPFHIFQALFVAQLGFIALFAGAWLLSRIPAGSSKSEMVKRVYAQRSPQKYSLADPLRVLKRSWVATLMIFSGLAVYLTFHHLSPVPLKADLALFPPSFGNWNRVEIPDVQEVLFRVEGADQELKRVYRNSLGHTIQLYVAYFESQHQSKEFINYLTAPLHDNVTSVSISTGGQTMTVNQILLKGERGAHRAFFWYDLSGRVVANWYQAKLMTSLDALTRGRTNGAFILVTSIHKDEALRDEEIAFIRELVPILRRFIS